jgi:hypothetical protein
MFNNQFQQNTNNTMMNQQNFVNPDFYKQQQ